MQTGTILQLQNVVRNESNVTILVNEHPEFLLAVSLGRDRKKKNKMVVFRTVLRKKINSPLFQAVKSRVGGAQGGQLAGGLGRSPAFSMYS